jgi:hypothetical protein
MAPGINTALEIDPSLEIIQSHVHGTNLGAGHIHRVMLRNTRRRGSNNMLHKR